MQALPPPPPAIEAPPPERSVSTVDEVRVAAAAAGLEAPRVDDLVLAVNELAANSVDHGGGAGVLRRGVPVRRVAGRLVTTVFDLLLAQYGVARPGLPGEWPAGYEDASHPGTPAWAAEMAKPLRRLWLEKAAGS